MSLSERFREMFRREREAPIQLGIKLPERSPTSIARPPGLVEPSAVVKPLPGNYLSFPFHLEVTLSGKAHIAYPKTAIFDTTAKRMRWGDKVSPEWESILKNKLRWEDDPERGIGQREIVNVEDVLGAEGRIQGHLYRFEQILDLGNNVVVYALFQPQSNSRLAYGFSRDVFQPGYLYSRREDV